MRHRCTFLITRQTLKLFEVKMWFLKKEMSEVTFHIKLFIYLSVLL